MLTIGLTGGIGSGKSTVAAMFAAVGAPIIDADTIAKEIVANDAIITQKIVAYFGAAVLDKHARLDRAQLRRHIFADPQNRGWLEALLHPWIIAEIKQRVLRLHTKYCIIAIPLLVEKAAARQLVDRVLVVDAAEEMQISRTMQRDKLSLIEVQAILAVQADRHQRLSVADDVIYNDGDITALQQMVWRLHQQYTQHY